MWGVTRDVRRFLRRLVSLFCADMRSINFSGMNNLIHMFRKVCASANHGSGCGGARGEDDFWAKAMGHRQQVFLCRRRPPRKSCRFPA